MKKSKSKERSRLINDTSSSALDESVIPKTYFASNQSKLHLLEDKIKMYGNLDQIEEEFLKDITANNQRLDNIIMTVKNVMKIDNKSKKQQSLSPLSRMPSKVDKEKPSKRLIERVEKAITQQNLMHNSK